MKAFLAIENEEINEKIRSIKEIEIVDNEDNLHTLMDLLQFVITDFLIINSLLDDTGKKLVEIAKIARGKDIKIIMLVDDPEETKDKLLITNLAIYGVNAFIKISEFSEEKLIKFLQDYPEEFDFRFVNEVVEKVVEKQVKVVVEKTVTKIIKQHILTFYTTDNNLNKDEVVTNFAVLLAKRTEQKILVIDANMPTPTLDFLFGVHKEIYVKDIYDLNRVDTGISACYGAIEKGVFSADMLKEFVIKVPKLKNLYVLTGLYDLTLFFKRLEVKHYTQIIEAAKQIYDTIIINVNPFETNTATYAAFLSANKIIVTCEPNWAYARNCLAIVNDINKRLKISKDKFNFLINNTDVNSLDKDHLKKIFEGFKVIGFLPHNKYHMKFLNKNKPLITSLYAKNDITAYIDLIENLEYKPKSNIFQRIFKKDKEINAVLDSEIDTPLNAENKEELIDLIKDECRR